MAKKKTNKLNFRELDEKTVWAKTIWNNGFKKETKAKSNELKIIIKNRFFS